jgi:hypothetical protein
MGEKKTKASLAGPLGWLLDLLTTTSYILAAATHEELRKIADRITNDDILNDHHRNMLRLIFGARWKEIEPNAVSDQSLVDMQGSFAYPLAQLLDLLSLTQLIMDCVDHAKLKQLGDRVGADQLLANNMKNLLRLIFRARSQQITDANPVKDA